MVRKVVEKISKQCNNKPESNKVHIILKKLNKIIDKRKKVLYNYFIKLQNKNYVI